MKIRHITAFALSAVIAFLIPCTAFANSAPKQWYGRDSYGAIVSDEECPLTVESELLTFDIPDFPKKYPDEENALAYQANVTAQYTFYNPADHTVTAKLEFPFGRSPEYGGSGYGTDRYDVTVNGSAIEKTLRHTLNSYKFDIEKDLPLILDEYKNDTFYRPDLPVKKYTLEILDYDKSYEHAWIGFEFSLSNSRVIIRHSFQSGGSVAVRIGSDKFITFYIIGEQEMPLYRFYDSGLYETRKEISGQAKLVSAEEMTFEELVFENYPEDSAIHRTDWYNAVIDKLNIDHSYFPSLSDFDVNYSLMRWYEYEITLAPGESIINTVTAPIYPDIDGNWEPPVYGYTYLLSPAKKWADFGSLEIVINTPFYLSKNDDFEKTDTGYRLSLDGLPDGELEFSLCSSEKPKNANTGITALIVGLVVGVLTLLGVVLAVLAMLIYVAVVLIRYIIRKTT